MQNSIAHKPIIQVETVTWMQKIKAINTGEDYYTIGNVIRAENTLLVTRVGGNGGAVMFCVTHQHAYPIHETCEECRNAVVTVASEAGVTARYTPENKQETETR